MAPTPRHPRQHGRRHRSHPGRAGDRRRCVEDAEHAVERFARGVAPRCCPGGRLQRAVHRRRTDSARPLERVPRRDLVGGEERRRVRHARSMGTAAERHRRCDRLGPRRDRQLVDLARWATARPARHPLHRRAGVRRCRLDRRRPVADAVGAARGSRRSTRSRLGDGPPDDRGVREPGMAPAIRGPQRRHRRGEPPRGRSDTRASRSVDEPTGVRRSRSIRLVDRGGRGGRRRPPGDSVRR